MTLTIGKWIEESRDITHCPSYYAADHETIRTKAGEYPVNLKFVGGYLVPMPYWLTIGIAGDRISGALYSGFGGVNYSKTDLPLEPTTYCLQLYSYGLPELVASGKVTLDAGFEWLAENKSAWQHEKAPKTWEALAAMGGVADSRY